MTWMRSTQTRTKRVNHRAALLLIAGAMACHSVSYGASSVTIINYTDTTFASVRVVDPNRVDNHSPAQEAVAYSAGGQVCCYQLPRTWHHGLQVDVETEAERAYPAPKAYSGPKAFSEPEAYPTRHTRPSRARTAVSTARIRVPRYLPGQAQMIWVQILPNNQYRVIATDRTPNQPDFPSDVKGWPVPSAAFRHTLWEKDVAETQQKLARATRGLQALHRISESERKAYWAVWSEQQEVESKHFSGYNDPRFLAFLHDVFCENKAYAQERLKQLSTFEPK